MVETIPAALAGMRVDRVVALLTGRPRADVADLVAAGAVVVDGRPITTRSHRVAEGQVLEIDAPPAAVAGAASGDAAVAVEVVHADSDVIVVDKPAGLVVHPGAGNATGTLVQGLLARFPDLAGVGDPARPGIVHRLDKGTSGLLVVARSARAYAALVAMLSARTVERRYVTLVRGIPEAPAGVVDAPIGRATRDRTRMAVSAEGRESRTRYQVTRRYPDADLALLECSLETGRTHQIRVHLAAIGHPVVGDARYGGARRGVSLGRPFLHAAALGFDHPVTGERLSFTSALPADLVALLESLDSRAD